MFLFLSMVYLVASMVFYGVVTLKTPPDAVCVKALFPSSMAEDVIEYKFKNFHDEFFSISTYRGPPTVEREMQWDSLVPFKMFSISGQRMKVSENLHSAVDSGSDLRPVPAVMISMNCLKSLRRYIYDASNDTLFTPPTRQEADECIDILREEFMCSLGTTPYLIADNPGNFRGFAPVIGNMHYCRDYEQIARWITRTYDDID